MDTERRKSQQMLLSYNGTRLTTTIHRSPFDNETQETQIMTRPAQGRFRYGLGVRFVYTVKNSDMHNC